MKKIALLLLLLPSLAFACPNLTGNYHCEVKKLDTGLTVGIDIGIKTEDNVYTLSSKKPGVGSVEWVANGATRRYLAPIPDGVIVHSTTVSCEGDKLHLIESQLWYHDATVENFKEDMIPARSTSISEFLSLDGQGNLIRDDTWTKGNPGGSTTENIPMVCTRTKEETK